ncbi:MAG: GNAT family N-acetyltransferase [Herbaspirillum sp.]
MDPSPESYCSPKTTSTPEVDVLVREAHPDDAELIAELTRISWAGRVRSDSSGHHEGVDRVLHDLRLGGGFILIVSNLAVGSVRWLPDDYEPDVWDIIRMGVLPSHRGLGLSQHLLEAVIHHALLADIKELRLTVHAQQSRLVDLYSAFGFELAPELETEHQHSDKNSSVVMRKALGR